MPAMAMAAAARAQWPWRVARSASELQAQRADSSAVAGRFSQGAAFGARLEPKARKLMDRVFDHAHGVGWSRPMDPRGRYIHLKDTCRRGRSATGS